MKFSIKDFFRKCDRIRRRLRIWSHLLKKPLMENLIFCAVYNSKKSVKKIYDSKASQNLFESPWTNSATKYLKDFKEIVVF